MSKPEVSVCVSTFNRLALWRRTLWNLAKNPPRVPFELVVCDDGSDEDVLGEVKKYSSLVPWTFARFDREAYERATGLKKFFNNPCTTTNISVRLSKGNVIILQGQEVIPYRDCYSRLLADAPKKEYYLAFSTTYDVPADYLALMDEAGDNVEDRLVTACHKWPLHTEHYRSDVINYVSATPRRLWDEVGGNDERYYGGISAEDSDFVRRARTLDCPTVISPAVSLHQSHGGRTQFYWPDPKVITRERFEEGCRVNRAVYDAWAGERRSQQPWEWGTLGVGEVLTNTK